MPGLSGPVSPTVGVVFLSSLLVFGDMVFSCFPMNSSGLTVGPYHFTPAFLSG